VVTDADVAWFTDAGFVVLRNDFDPAPLLDEVDRAKVATRVRIPLGCHKKPSSATGFGSTDVPVNEAQSGRTSGGFAAPAAAGGGAGCRHAASAS
jgi:hypothetical protein